MTKEQFTYDFKNGVVLNPVLGGDLYKDEKLPEKGRGREKSHRSVEYLKFDKIPEVENRFKLNDGNNIYRINVFDKISYDKNVNVNDSGPYKNVATYINLSDNPNRANPMQYF